MTLTVFLCSTAELPASPDPEAENNRAGVEPATLSKLLPLFIPRGGPRATIIGLIYSTSLSAPPACVSTAVKRKCGHYVAGLLRNVAEFGWTFSASCE